MSTRVTHELLRVRVAHTCTTHDEVRTVEFDVQSVRRYENGGVRYEMTRCDGSALHAWAEEVEVVQ